MMHGEQRKSVVVIGAGVAGLATAALLGREDYKVTVVERNDEVGGRAGNLEVDGFRFDTGPSWYLMPEAFDHFFELCGTSTSQEMSLTNLVPAYRVYSGPGNGGFVDVATGVDEVAALFEAIETGAGQKVRDYLGQSSDVYRISLESFLYTTFSDPRTMLTAEVRSRLMLLAKLLSHSLEATVDAQFKDHRLRQILQYPAVFLSSQPKEAPALYQLMSHTDLIEGVRYPQGGFAGFVRALECQALKAGVRFEMSTDVTSIETTKKGRRTAAAGVRVCAPDGRNRFIPADVVVSAADLHHTETALLPAHLRTYPERYFAQREPGLSTVLLLLGVNGELPQLLHHTLLFSRDWSKDFKAVYEGPEPSRPLGASESIYISKPSATDPDVAPEGYENLFVLVPVPPDPSIGFGSAYREESPRVAAIADAAIDQIATWAGIDDLRQRIVVRETIGPADFAERYNAWSAGAIGPAHTLRQSAFLRGRNASRKVDGLYYAGATTVPGVGVPMCLISAENVVKRLRGDTSGGPLPASSLHTH